MPVVIALAAYEFGFFSQPVYIVSYILIFLGFAVGEFFDHSLAMELARSKQQVALLKRLYKQTAEHMSDGVALITNKLAISQHNQ